MKRILICSIIIAVIFWVWIRRTDTNIRMSKRAAFDTVEFANREWERLLAIRQWKTERDQKTRFEMHRKIENMFTETMNSNQNPFEKLAKLMKFYKTGFFPYLRPNAYMAKKCASCIAKYAPRNLYGLKFEAQQLLLDDEINKLDISPDAVDPFAHFGESCIEDCLRIRTKENVLIRLRRKPDTETPRAPRRPIENDAQNSHDHGVVRSVKKIMDEEKFREYSDFDRIDQEIRASIIACDVSDDAKVCALETLDTLDDETVHPTLQMTEKNILQNVWKKCDPETTILQLASCIENGAVVCHTGKCTRMVSALDSGRKNSVQPMWSVKQQLMNKALKIRSNVLSSSSKSEQENYESGTGNLREKMIDRFERETRSDFSHLDNKIRHSVMNEIIEGF